MGQKYIDRQESSIRGSETAPHIARDGDSLDHWFVKHDRLGLLAGCKLLDKLQQRKSISGRTNKLNAQRTGKRKIGQFKGSSAIF
jgi:hypothetical protein